MHPFFSANLWYTFEVVFSVMAQQAIAPELPSLQASLRRNDVRDGSDIQTSNCAIT